MTAYEKLMGINKPKEFIDTITKDFGYCEAPKNGSSHRVFKSKGKPPLSIPNEKLSPGVRRDLVKLILGNDYYAQKKQ
jgi:hypothetical protein